MPETPTHPRQLSPVAYPRRVAMISVHTSPLATPGVGDAGGLNVYVAELAKRLIGEAAKAQGDRLVRALADLRAGASLPAHGADSVCGFCEMRGLCRRGHV